VAVFIDGDFWHGWRYPQWRASLTHFWQKKIDKNRDRDQRNFRRLRAMDWTVIRIWQHQLDRDIGQAIERVLVAIKMNNG
jgi:DNA mismatch endonuclease (patch repair protein)